MSGIMSDHMWNANSSNHGKYTQYTINGMETERPQQFICVSVFNVPVHYMIFKTVVIIMREIRILILINDATNELELYLNILVQ